MSANKAFKIVTNSKSDYGHWRIVRKSDNKTVKIVSSVFEACRWVLSWGRSYE